MFRKIVVICFLFGVLFVLFVNSSFVQMSLNVQALENQSNIQNDAQSENLYVIYSVDGKYLFEKQNVIVGDEYIDKEMRIYVVIEVDETTKTGKAKFVERFDLPKVKKKEDVPASAVANARGKVGIYMTHNDESYVSGDGYDSVYGKGGIHDIAYAFSLNLNSKRISTVFSENLHIPHDNNAYSRSSVTAKSLLNNYGSEAIFDIHRDGTSRGFYITKVNGEEKCMVRMVVGKSSANYSKNKAFALFLMAVAKEYVPWLFVDIYLGAGHYNQGLSEYAMLFEMGSHLVEKDLVLKTVPYLAEVVSIALYGELEVVPEDKNNANSNEDSNKQESDINNNETNNENLPNDEDFSNSSQDNTTNNNSEEKTENTENQSNGLLNGGENLKDFEESLNGEFEENISNNNEDISKSSSSNGVVALLIVIAGIFITYSIYIRLKVKKK